MKRTRKAVAGTNTLEERSVIKTGSTIQAQIDAYVRKKNAAFREVTDGLRQLVKKTVPKSRETLNPWGLPTFVWRGAVCYFMVGKQHVTFGFLRGAELPDPAKLLEGTGKSLRHVKLREKAQLLDANLRDLILSAVSLNRRDPRKSMFLQTVNAPKAAGAYSNKAFAGMHLAHRNSKKNAARNVKSRIAKAKR